jgi:hypothetical protein
VDVCHAVVIVDNGLGRRIVIQGVDGEVAPGGVFGLCTVLVVAEHPPVGIGLCGFGVMACAKRGHFHGFATAHHMHDLEAPADDARTAEKRAHLFRRGAGRNVIVLGRVAAQQITNGAPDDERRVAVLLEHRAYPARGGRQLLAADSVPGRRNQVPVRF